jgi:hypothetical protein
MEYTAVQDLLSRIHGCTFASLDAVTVACKGVQRRVSGERVILFTNKKSSGYENMVRRRLQEAGLDPDWKAGPLPWGERVPNTPMIFHKDVMYLQTIFLGGGDEKYFLGENEVDPAAFKIKPNAVRAEGNRVVVNTYRLESITRIKLLGEERRA